MDVRRCQIDRRLNCRIRAFKGHHKRNAEDYDRPFTQRESKPRAKRNRGNGGNDMYAHVPFALHGSDNSGNRIQQRLYHFAPFIYPYGGFS